MKLKSIIILITLLALAGEGWGADYLLREDGTQYLREDSGTILRETSGPVHRNNVFIEMLLLGSSNLNFGSAMAFYEISNFISEVNNERV